MRLLLSAALAALLSLSAIAPASAQSSDARYLAANCANCHGTDGRSADGSGMPGLAGLSATYFIEQMNAFRDGKRQATIMHQLAKGYTDAQIAAMAQYFASQKTGK
jgi:cytochrome c553